MVAHDTYTETEHTAKDHTGLPGVGTTPISLEAEAAVMPIANPTASMEKYDTAGDCTNVPWVELRADKASVQVESAFWKSSVPSHLAGINLTYNIWFYAPTLIAGNVKFQILISQGGENTVVDIVPTDAGNTGDVAVPGTTKWKKKATISSTLQLVAGNKYILQLKTVVPSAGELNEHTHILGIDIKPT